MSVPTEFDFAILKIGDGEGPEVFTLSCGKQDLTFNVVANSTDRAVRDCAKPGEIPFRKAKVTSKQLDVTAAGLTDVTAYGVEFALVGTFANCRVEVYADNGTDTGDLLGTVAGNFLVSSLNVNAPRETDASAELTLASNGSFTWTAAP